MIKARSTIRDVGFLWKSFTSNCTNMHGSTVVDIPQRWDYIILNISCRRCEVIWFSLL